MEEEDEKHKKQVLFGFQKSLTVLQHIFGDADKTNKMANIGYRSVYTQHG